MAPENDNSSALKTIVWSEVLPWLVIFRTFRLATGFRVLTLSAAAVLLMVGVSAVLEAVFRDARVIRHRIPAEGQQPMAVGTHPKR